MSKNQEAPGELELVRAFVNTLDLEADVEELTDPASLGAWLAEQGLSAADERVGPADLRHALDLREALRVLLLAHNGNAGSSLADASRTLDDAVCRARVRMRFDEEGRALLEPQADGVAGALGRLLVIVQVAIASGTWERLKACRDESCEWAFYDHTKNRSGAWCTMDVCGNRAKARAYRERRVGP
jgi:predicted RNA-binding Zn ribbon-like protein